MRKILETIRQTFWEKTLPQFDTSCATRPPNVRKRKKTIGEPIQEDLKFNVNSLKFEKENETNHVSVREWESVDIRTTRQKALTKSDIEVLTSRKLDIEKARIIKTFWAQKLPRKTIAFELKQRGFTRGYYESLIGLVCAALAYANGEGDGEGEE